MFQKNTWQYNLTSIIFFTGRAEKQKLRRKNKEARSEHRLSLTKLKDANALFADLHALDEINFAKKIGREVPNEPRSKLSTLVLHQKEKKALKSLNEIIEHLQKDNPDEALKLKSRLTNFYNDRLRRNEEFESATNSNKSLDIHSIPLPDQKNEIEQISHGKNLDLQPHAASDGKEAFLKSLGDPPSPPHGISNSI